MLQLDAGGDGDEKFLELGGRDRPRGYRDRCRGVFWTPKKYGNVGAKNGGLMGFNGIYPLVICYIAMERSTILNGKIHYFYGHFQ